MEWWDRIDVADPKFYNPLLFDVKTLELVPLQESSISTSPVGLSKMKIPSRIRRRLLAKISEHQGNNLYGSYH